MASPKRDEMILLANRLIREEGYHALGFHHGPKSSFITRGCLSQFNFNLPQKGIYSYQYG